MTRQSFHKPESSQAPAEPMDLIPTAKSARRSRAKRTRRWEEMPEHHARGYRVPDHLRAMVGEKNDDTGMRAYISDVADEHTATTSVVAQAMMLFALSELRAGNLPLNSRAKPAGRTMQLEWSIREDAWPREVPSSKRKKRKTTSALEPKPIFLSYRWGRDIDGQIKAVASSAGVTSGEVVVYLLNHAIQSYRSGRLNLLGVPKIVKQTVTPSW